MKDKKIDCFDFDIQNAREVRSDAHQDFDRKTDYSCKCLNVDMKEKRKHLIEVDILNNSDFDENFEIDF